MTFGPWWSGGCRAWRICTRICLFAKRSGSNSFSAQPHALDASGFQIDQHDKEHTIEQFTRMESRNLDFKTTGDTYDVTGMGSDVYHRSWLPDVQTCARADVYRRGQDFVATVQRQNKVLASIKHRELDKISAALELKLGKGCCIFQNELCVDR